MPSQRVLFVISNNPFSKDRRSVIKLLDELLKAGATVEVFLHGNGVWWLGDTALRRLAQRGVSVYCGGDSAAKRGVEIPDWAESLSLEDFSELALSADKLLFFN